MLQIDRLMFQLSDKYKLHNVQANLKLTLSSGNRRFSG